MTQHPNKYRAEAKLKVGEESLNVVHIVNGKEGWQQLGDTATVKKIESGVLKGLHIQFQVDLAAALVPLLDKEKYTVSSIGEHEVDGKMTTGLSIKNKAGLDVKFYFDQETHSVVKQEFGTTHFITGKDVLAEAYLSKYKETKGIMIPRHVDLHHDGKQSVTATFDSVQLDQQLDASLFQKPMDSLGVLAKSGKVETLKEAITTGLDLNKQHEHGLTPLTWAAISDKADAVELLLKSGARIDEQNEDGGTTLLCAAYFGRLEMVELLVKNKADVNIKTNSGFTSLDVAVPWNEKIRSEIESIAEALQVKVDIDEVKVGRQKAAALLRESGGKAEKEYVVE